MKAETNDQLGSGTNDALSVVGLPKYGVSDLSREG